MRVPGSPEKKETEEMLKKIKLPNGTICMINTNNITKAELQPVSNFWKIYFTDQDVFDSPNFNSEKEALKWFNDNIEKLD